MDISGFTIIDRVSGEPGSLRWYQEECITKALNQQSVNGRKFQYGNLYPGAGKTLISVAGCQELFNRDEIDICLVFTPKSVKSDFTKTFQKSSSLTCIQVEGTPAKRRVKYRSDAQVFILNYEKLRATVDLGSLIDLCSDKRVLIVADEVQKIVKGNQASEGLARLLDVCQSSVVWPMSASVLNGDPERLWAVYELSGQNPLGTLDEFRETYVSYTESIVVPIVLKNGHKIQKTNLVRHWNHGMLREVPALVEPLTYTARKTDPGIAETLKGLQFIPVEVPMDPKFRDFYNDLIELAKEAKRKGNPTMDYFNALRVTCLFPESHHITSGSLSQDLVNANIDFSQFPNNKLERILHDIQNIVEAGDKVVVFSTFANLVLGPLNKALTKAKIKHVLHTGSDSAKQQETAKNTFMQDASCSVFLSSDAGATGLNLQVARYVFSYEPTQSYDLTIQRANRIARMDSHLDGLEARVYYYQDTLEERMMHKMEQRRMLSATIQGTDEPLSYGNESMMSPSDIDWFLDMSDLDN